MKPIFSLIKKMNSKIFFVLLFSLLFTACQSPSKNTLTMGPHFPDANPHTGYTSMVQVATNENETYINILRGRQATYSYSVSGPQGVPTPQIELYQTISPLNDFQWAIDKVHISHLKPNTKYTLRVFHKKYKILIEQREFQSLDLHKSSVRFAVGSCTSDNYRFQHVFKPIWQLLSDQNPDLLLLIGDNVYVDDSDLVARGDKVSSRDIWQRYVSTLRTLPIYKQKKLIPILATWDDHDFGTNNSNKLFSQKKTSKKAFLAFFSSPNLEKVYLRKKNHIFFEFKGFGQRFLFLDNRFFREKSPSSKKYGFWGQQQQKWALNILKSSSEPTWIASGGQFFSPPFLLKNGRQVNESFMSDYKKNHKLFVEEIKKTKTPVAFLSGDIHYTQLLELEPSLLGYKSYEFTSSPMHSYIYRASSQQDEFFENTRSLLAIKDYNFLLVESDVSTPQRWKLTVTAFGPKAPQGFFKKELSISIP